EKKSPNPISILSIVPNDEEAEMNIIKSRNKLEEYVKQASATEIKANIITAIDHNISSGIARTSREIMADIIIIEWQNKTNFFDKLMGDKIETIINKVDKTILICDFKTPLISSKRIVLISPPLSEKENGFDLWLKKVTKLSKELSIPMVHYGDSKTQENITSRMKVSGYTTPIEFKAFNDWEDFLILSREINADDLIVFISSRKGSVSYINVLEAIPVKLNKFFERNNKVLVYPQQYESAEFDNDFEDISSGTITKGIESISKQIQGLFRKNKKDN
ncbi:MAG: cation:proton antiporter, partial [Bacteroidia bacterium]